MKEVICVFYAYFCQNIFVMEYQLYNTMYTKKKYWIFMLVLWCCATWAYAQSRDVSVAVSGNSYVTNRSDEVRIGGKGTQMWTHPETVVSTYFYIPQPQTLHVAVRGKGEAAMLLSCNGKKEKVVVKGEEPVVCGNLKVKVQHPGYVRVDLKGLEKQGNYFADITDIVLRNVEGDVTYVHDFSDYWGRRGPSVHLNYPLPEGDFEWFYNEVTVPEDGETMHSYYMVAGFGEGYFGMQYNSDTERRILFSVWSPFETQNPKEIPEDHRVVMLRRGKDVHIGEFGNEGSGGQSYLRYPWKAGNTYPFLMQVRPDGKGNTIYTAYFYAADDKEWRLIAEFLRPKTNTWYKRPHSFLENFSPEQGYLTRKVCFSNQWARTAGGKWHRLTQAGFTNDGTARAGVRLDYRGGLTPDKKGVFLQMGGFFNENTPYGSRFTCEPPAAQEPPVIDWEGLKRL